jgi:hypothetical protein
VKESTRETQEEQDVMLEFIEPCMEFGEGYRVRTSEVNREYINWHKNNKGGMVPPEGVTDHKLSKRFKEKLIELNRGVTKGKNSYPEYQGVRFREDQYF